MGELTDSFYFHFFFSENFVLLKEAILIITCNIKFGEQQHICSSVL